MHKNNDLKLLINLYLTNRRKRGWDKSILPNENPNIIPST